tara:strand:+ start:822 stop:4571 length:3750 start_codon:yes stop_codon:yes gene_type:complete
MSTIRGIFEPFYKYITNQLRVRQRLLLKSANINNTSFNLTEIELEDQIFADSLDGVQLDEVTVVGGDFRDEKFLTYITERQCIIRMASGVDVKEKNNLLEEGEREAKGNGLAKRWVLESGIKGKSSGFNEGGYGDPTLRSDATDSFGIVPMPGITDATIETQSDDGAIRAATINFVCHNRRQLEILEALYMRPGYPLLLEWGWTPYISNDNKIERDEFSILDDFLDSNSNLNSLNESISGYKEDSGGNYDGFVGFCKNFSFKVREDGGYDCATEIMAHGEILDSLKIQTTLVPKIRTSDDFLKYNTNDNNSIQSKSSPQEWEIIDNFLYYLRSIKVNLNKAGLSAALQYRGTNREITYPIEMIRKDGKLEVATEYPKEIRQNSGEGVAVTQDFVDNYLTTWNLNGEPTQGARIVGSDEETFQYSYFGYNDENGNLIPINKLNVVDKDYGRGFGQIQELVKDITKVKDEEISKQYENWGIDAPVKVDIPSWNNFQQHVWNEEDGLGGGDQSVKGYRTYSTTGIDPMLEGTILKEMSLEEDSAADDSGIRKKIFIRWDLICQILNKKVTPQYKKDHALVELTYLNPNQTTYQSGENSTEDDEGYKKFPSKEEKYYLSYSSNVKTYDRVFREQLGQDQVGEFGTEENTNYHKNQEAQYTEAHKNEGMEYNTLGHSFDPNICLMPHQLDAMRRSEFGDKNYKINPLTSFTNTDFPSRAIGGVYFNLNYLISTYEDVILEKQKVTINGKETTRKKVKEEFSFHDWIKTIWGGVNDACGGYYDFKLHTEHSRPHVARIIDFTFSGDNKDIKSNRPIFNFDPQGLGSIARESSISSKLDSDMSHVISIAAQAPNDINSLDAMSFKAFHKNITNRFTSSENSKETLQNQRKENEEQYKFDVKQYNEALASLQYYILRMNQSNYETELIAAKQVGGYNYNEHYRRPMSPDIAKGMASNLEEMKHEIDVRHGEKDANGIQNNTSTMSLTDKDKNGNDILRPYVGSFREDTTFHRSAIIPITVSMTIDGIGGIHPLQIFKINPDKLPLGYQDPKIVFVVKKESQSITSGQDWTTTLEGSLTLLNNNPNESLTTNEYLQTKTLQGEELDKLDNEQSLTPEADRLRREIKLLSSSENPNLTFTIEEKIGASTITDPGPQLSSGGDIDPLLVDTAMSVFKLIKIELQNYLSIKIRITAGNDLYHQEFSENTNSLHKVGKAMDFTITPYNPQTKAAVEKALTESSLYFENDYETDIDDHFHFQV